jgi:hypothetical protein
MSKSITRITCQWQETLQDKLNAFGKLMSTTRKTSLMLLKRGLSTTRKTSLMLLERGLSTTRNSVEDSASSTIDTF